LSESRNETGDLKIKLLCLEGDATRHKHALESIKTKLKRRNHDLKMKEESETSYQNQVFIVFYYYT